MNYKRTTYACFVSIFAQSILTNLIALFFVPFRVLYGLDFIQLGLLVGINFLSQLLADIILTINIKKLNYKYITLSALALAILGLFFFASTPFLFGNYIFFGLLISIFVFSFASGMMEVVLSVIINNIPDDVPSKAPAMSLMHSFYAWGQVATIIITTFALLFFKVENWIYIAMFWTIIPLIGLILLALSPVNQGNPEEKNVSRKKILFQPFCIIAMFAIMFGAATEVVMNQWISTFAQVGLNFSKLTSDLLGMCLFAISLGIGRTLYGIFGHKINVTTITTYGALLSIICYLVTALSPIPIVSVLFGALCGFTCSLLWPGTLIISSEKFPKAGAFIFALLAISGDIGGAIAPPITGFLTDIFSASTYIDFAASLNLTTQQFGLRVGLLVSAIFPLLAFFAHVYLRKNKNKSLKTDELLEK